MQEAKVYRSVYNNTNYEVRISPAEINGAKGFSASVFSNLLSVGEIKNVEPSVDDALKAASLIIKAYDKYQGSIVSNITGTKSQYAIGTVKLSWLDQKDKKTVHSLVFDTVEDALTQTKGKKNWLLLELKQTDGDNTDWEILPYGANNRFSRSVTFQNSVILKGLAAVFIAAGLYFTITQGYKLLKTKKLVV